MTFTPLCKAVYVKKIIHTFPRRGNTILKNHNNNDVMYNNVYIMYIMLRWVCSILLYRCITLCAPLPP